MIIKGRRYPGPGGMFALSFICHLGVFSLIFWFNQASVLRPSEEQVTYVDMVTLPVASPQAGTPAPAAEASAPPAALVTPPAAAMVVPQAKPKAKLPASAKAQSATPAAEEKALDERLAKLARQAEEKRQADVLARLRKGSGANKTVGMPGAKGTQAGSDYGAYLQSRLRDAFKEVINYKSGAPQTLVRITVGPDGRISNFRVEKKSGDQVFDEAVAQAVTLAGRNFKPPPGGVPFVQVFHFKPEGVGLP